jgi:hypothetical protein
MVRAPASKLAEILEEGRIFSTSLSSSQVQDTACPSVMQLLLTPHITPPLV